MKGFAKLSTGETAYIRYQLQSEEQKNQFEKLHLTSHTFTAEAEVKDLPLPSHAYAFSMRHYSQMNGAASMMVVRQLQFVQKKRTIRTLLSERRAQIKQHIKQRFPESLQTEALALLIGDRSEMDEALAQEYRTLGITHLFAISGLHVGLLTFLVRSALLRIRVRREIIDCFLFIALPIYACLAGGAPSVWRAVSVTMLVLLCNQKRSTLRLDDALSLSAIGFMLYEPYVVFQPGFQLSYVAAAALVFSSTILARTTSPILLSFLVTSITQLALYPILLYHFFEVSLSSFIVNLAYVPLYSLIILPMNIILLLTSYVCPPIASGLFFLYMPLHSVFSSFTSWLASIPYQLWVPGKPPVPVMLLAISSVVWFFYLLETQKGSFQKYIVLFLPALVLHLLPYTDRSMHISFLDVGQGDSIVIEMPYKREVYVIDTGGTLTFGEPNWKTPAKSFEVGRNIVGAYLKGKGITKIDKLILTHADSDHVGGADELMEDFSVKEIHISPGSEDERAMEQVMQLAVEQTIPVLPVQKGVSWSTPKASFQYVAPNGTAYKGNDSSLVLWMQTATLNFLFTGDLEKEGEQKLIQDERYTNFGKLILKAGHHGSRTSSSELFIEALQPKLAIISAGKNNRYGHPHEEVLQTFEKYDVKTFSTAEEGTIILSIQDGKVQLQTMRQ